jgi:uncharacterized RDD family membrane protein YckC
MTWYYHQNGENKGPVAVEELHSLRSSNQITDDTLVWEQGMPEWAPFRASAAAMTPAMAGATVPLGTGYDLRPCTECGKAFPESDMLNYEGRWICPSCKPIFFQRLREGVALPGVLHYARVLARFCAIFIDGILINLVVLLPLILMYGFIVLTPAGRANVPFGLNIFFIVIQYLVPPLYEIIMISLYGATLGKMALKLKVVTADGGPISYGRSTGRYFAKILSSLILCIGYIMAIWDPEKRALHDRICQTRVITVDA